MATHDSTRHHAFDYLEIEALDVAQAQEFYAAALGWKFNTYGPDYVGIRAPGAGDNGSENSTGQKADTREIGGICKAKDGDGSTADPTSPRRPLAVIFSSNFDRTFESVKAAGAICEEPFDFPGGRRFPVWKSLTDPSGNELAVWSEL